jgi:RF-1 domain
MSAEYRDLNEQALLTQCRWDAFRGPGPGGQKRNKTSSSVRLTHLPTQIHVIAGESRSQVENKTRALRRLKMKLALEFRRPIDTRGWEPPPWLDQIRTRPAKDASPGVGMRLQISHRHPVYYHFVGLLLDLLESRNGHVSDVAGLLGLSTSSTIKFLSSDPHLLTTANQIRTRNNQPPLRRS